MEERTKLKIEENDSVNIKEKRIEIPIE